MASNLIWQPAATLGGGSGKLPGVHQPVLSWPAECTQQAWLALASGEIVGSIHQLPTSRQCYHLVYLLAKQAHSQ